MWVRPKPYAFTKKGIGRKGGLEKRGHERFGREENMGHKKTGDASMKKRTEEKKRETASAPKVQKR